MFVFLILTEQFFLVFLGFQELHGYILATLQKEE